MLQQPRKKSKQQIHIEQLQLHQKQKKYSNTEQSYSLKLLLSNANTDKLINLKKKNIKKNLRTLQRLQTYVSTYKYKILYIYKLQQLQAASLQVEEFLVMQNTC